eukprot:jgi/Chrzof1/264/Cz01g09070.t1
MLVSVTALANKQQPGGLQYVVSVCGHCAAPLMQVEFAAIADSSTGGGGLPRPGGRFMTSRGGDGAAIWDRITPAQRQSRHPSAVRSSDPLSSSCDISTGPATANSRHCQHSDDKQANWGVSANYDVITITNPVRWRKT